jgi:hypothetical protein
VDLRATKDGAVSTPSRRIVETLVLAATAVFLLGHGFNGGGGAPTCSTRAAESRSYNVVGTCGPAGVVTVSTDPCVVVVTGDDVGLPTSGRVAADLDYGFHLSRSIDSDWNVECDAVPGYRTDGGAAPDGALGLLCRRYPSATNPAPLATDVDWCVADVRPVTPTCDIHACAAVTCASGEHTAFGASSCCPTCVPDGPDDPLPIPPPPICHRETCPQSCPAGQEPSVPQRDICCGTCQTPPQECLDGRAQWLTELTTAWAAARACAADADCTITAVGSQCQTACPDAIAVDQIGTLSTWAGTRGAELCAACTTQAPACPALPPARPGCSNGTCVLIPL